MGLTAKNHALVPAVPSTTTMIRTVTHVRRRRFLRRFSAARWERRRGPWDDPGMTSDRDISVTLRRPPPRSPPGSPTAGPGRRSPRGPALRTVRCPGRTAGLPPPPPGRRRGGACAPSLLHHAAYGVPRRCSDPRRRAAPPPVRFAVRWP